MPTEKEIRDKYERKVKPVVFLRKIRQDIFLLMATIMIVAAGAYWLDVTFRSEDNIIYALYAAGVVLALVFKYTGFFKKKYYSVAMIVILSLMIVVYLGFNHFM